MLVAGAPSYAEVAVVNGSFFIIDRGAAYIANKARAFIAVNDVMPENTNVISS